MLLYPSSSSIPWTTTAPQPCPRCNAAPRNPREPLRFENRSFSAPCCLPAASLSRIPQSKKPRSSFGHSIRCAAVGEDRKQGSRGSELQNPLYLKDYYEVLGVSVDASYDEIRKAYRRLQKKHHPDVTGDKGHAMTLLINEAYQTLISEDLRDAYKALHSERTANSGAINTSFTGFAFSSWRGPDRPQGIFVDENTCIGCRECVFHASKTFKMDEPSGCARVMTQWGDSETQIKVALEACPVNCIHYVEREDLPILEFLIRPQLKASNGVYGGGWERPSNVFMAARTFKRKLKSASHSSSGEPSWRQETPAQREARINADLKMRAGAFWWLWLWGTATNQQQGWGSKEPSQRDADKWSWKKLLGRSCTSEILTMPVDSTEVLKVISLVQEWAITFASSSELPLPMPFRADPLTNGVQLSLITTSNGLIESIGSLLVTVEEIPATEAAALGELFSRDVENSGTKENWWLRVKRQGKVGTRPLPGEGRIVQHLKDAIQGCDSAYMKYYLHRS